MARRGDRPSTSSPTGTTGAGPARRRSTSCWYQGEEPRSHRVRSAEIWLWHSGGPLTLQYDGITVTLGPDVAAGQQPQVVVPPGAWQSARPAGGQAVLVSCVGSPGFDFADFTPSPAGQPG
ncbi:MULTISPECIES: cupin domain-containing protein [Kribbella]|uniref:cupin domain-containing protein n=1 Tax=Kribbella TaxID=182639 RepID=UPI0021085EF9|nr:MULTISPECIES: cupin domain-containing protein [Kribbella]